MLGLTRLINWFHSSQSIGNELEAKLKQAEAEITDEWHKVTNGFETRIAELEARAGLRPTAPPTPQEPAPAAAAAEAPVPPVS